MIYEWIRLSLASHIGPARAQLLLNTFGSIDLLFEELSRPKLSTLLPASIVQELQSKTLCERAERVIQWCDSKGVTIITLEDSFYPQKMKEIYGAPPILYALGDVSLLDSLSISIVGMREPDGYGQHVAANFAEAFAQSGYTVVSGLAYGVDKIAHEASLRVSGQTIAVMATGLDTIYPAAHRGLAQEIVQKGLIVTEFAPGVRGEPYRFIQRNRIISGLSEATVVVQAGMKSGALATARFALEQGRDLFAVPGPITSDKSWGTNNLLAQGAAPALTPSQVMTYLRGSVTVEQMEIPLRQQRRPPAPQVLLTLQEEELLFQFPPQGTISTEQLLEKTPFDLGELFGLLFDLEMRGIVTMGAGNCYQRA